MKVQWKENMRTSGFTRKNPDKNKSVYVHRGDIVDVDTRGYLWKDGVCFGHKDSAAYAGSYDVCSS